MAQVALFVDAGYLLAGAHDLLGGTVSRSAFDCNFESLCRALRSEVESHSGAGLTFLRTYWCDGARDGIPTADHRRVGDLAYVKVRLGRLNRRGQQKGVDGLIYRDLTALARVGAVRRAYLFTGDEDIRESVVAAQDLGVQVVLITFKPTAQTGRSAALTREVDEVVVLDHMFWQPHFTKRTTAAVTLGPPSETDLRACAAPFAAEWTKGATASEVTALLDQAPRIPKDLYVQLLLAAETTVGSLRSHPESKGVLRREFWDALKRETRERRRASLGIDDATIGTEDSEQN